MMRLLTLLATFGSTILFIVFIGWIGINHADKVVLLVQFIYQSPVLFFIFRLIIYAAVFYCFSLTQSSLPLREQSRLRRGFIILVLLAELSNLINFLHYARPGETDAH